MKVLAVDDDPVFRDIFAAMLVSHGITNPTVVASGPAALALSQSAKPPFDCIFIDIQMPGMDGIELCEILRALDPSRRAQIVMITSSSERRFLDQAFKAGADDFLTKPLDNMEVTARLRSLRRIYTERIRNEEMRKEIETARSLVHRVRFDEALPSDRSIGTVDPSTLENYLQALGRLRRSRALVIGFHTENAASLFALTSDSEYARVMTEVADCILYAASPAEMMLASAGQGDFVAVVPSARSFAKRGALEARINSELRRRIALDIGAISLSVRVGAAISVPLLSNVRTDTVLRSALASARPARSTQD